MLVRNFILADVSSSMSTKQRPPYLKEEVKEFSIDSEKQLQLHSRNVSQATSDQSEVRKVARLGLGAHGVGAAAHEGRPVCRGLREDAGGA